MRRSPLAAERLSSTWRSTEWRPGYVFRQFGSTWRAAIGELSVSFEMPLPEIIEGFRRRPSSWIGSVRPSFSALVGLIAGYAEAHSELQGPQAESPLPRNFDRFVRRAVNAKYAQSKYGAGQHWTSIISSEAADDGAALEFFYELWDAYGQEPKS